MADVKRNRYYTYIKPVIENKFFRSYAPYIFSILAMIIFVVFAIRPTIITILTLQKSIQENQQVLDQVNQKAKNLTEAKQMLDSLDPVIKAKISNRLPPSPAVTTLIQSLQGSMSKEGTISALQVQPITVIDNTPREGAKQTIADVGFALNTQGVFPNLLVMLDHIYNSPRIISITNLTLNKTGEGPLSLSISGKAYYLK